MPTTHRVILAEDHAMVRECIKAMLSKCPAFSVTDEACDGYELLKLLRERPPPDVIILDLSMPRLGGLEAIREIRKMNLDIRILVLTMHKEEDFLCRSFMEGADGYLLKDDLSAELFTALDTVLRAEIYLSPTMAGEVENAWLKLFIARKATSDFDTLTSRETEVLKLLARGESNSRIAHTLDITPGAVGHHRAAIAKKLHADTRASLLK